MKKTIVVFAFLAVLVAGAIAEKPVVPTMQKASAFQIVGMALTNEELANIKGGEQAPVHMAEIKKITEKVDAEYRKSIEITRNVNPDSYQGNNPPPRYQDKIELKKGDTVIFSSKCQGSASEKGPVYKGITVYNPPEGSYSATLEDYSSGGKQKGNYKNVVRIVSAVLVHADAWTNESNTTPHVSPPNKSWGEPHSAGCPVLKLEDKKVLDACMDGIGLKYDNKTKIIVKIKKHY